MLSDTAVKKYYRHPPGACIKQEDKEFAKILKATTGGLWPGFVPPVMALKMLLPRHSSI